MQLYSIMWGDSLVVNRLHVKVFKEWLFLLIRCLNWSSHGMFGLFEVFPMPKHGQGMQEYLLHAESASYEWGTLLLLDLFCTVCSPHWTCS